MHTKFYKLRADPFRLSPDPRFCFPHRTYRKAMAYMRHALHRAEGFIVITGQPGMGKTTLINDLLRGIRPDELRIVRLVSTQLLADDLLRLVAYELALDPEGIDKASVLNRIGHYLKQQHAEGRRTLLVVDEAQDVTEEALEELRLLTNIQVDGQQLLQIFLVGQEELRDVVSSPTLVQLHQRVIAAAHIEPLNPTETKEYIKHRLQRVGWEGNPLISNQTFAMIHQFSRGIPRQINQICSRLLLHGSIEERHRLGLQDLKIIIDELHAEMLLPLGVQEIADTVSWSSGSQQETYDTRPRHRTGTPAVANTPSNNDTAASAARTPSTTIRDRPTPTGPTAGTGGGVAINRQSDMGSAANTAAHGNIVNASRPVTSNKPASATAVKNNRNDMTERSRNPLRMAVLTVLTAALLFALLLGMNSETGIRLRDKLTSLVLSVKLMQSQVEVHPAPNPAAEPNRHTNNVPAQPELQPAATQGTAAEPVTVAELMSGLETDLGKNGLRVEHLEDDVLKVNLSNEGIFEFNSTEISDTAGTELNKLVEVLRRHAETSIRIVGHTDSSGNPGFNLALSQVRARVVADYLISQGLLSEHIRSEGRGDRDTSLENSTRDRPDLKRRIEVYISPLQGE